MKIQAMISFFPPLGTHMLRYFSLLVFLCLSSAPLLVAATGCVVCSCNSQCCFIVEENSQPGTVIGNASDINDEELQRLINGTSPVTYTVTSPHANFSVTSNGIVSTAEPLDRESISLANDDCLVLVLLVTGESGSGWSRAISVKVLDVNDNPPEFSGVDNGLFKNSQQETTGPANNFLCSNRLLATDVDEGPNGTIASYSVLSPPNTFSVSSYDSSRVCLNSLVALDRETNATITIVIVAWDNGTVVRLNGTLTVILTLVDINDNSPVFTNVPPSGGLMVPESTPINTTVFNFKASDPDVGSNARIVFHLDPSIVIPFNLDNNGSLYVSGLLDSHIANCIPKTYTLSVIVTNADTITDPKTTSSSTIIITNVNERPPSVEINSIATSLEEGLLDAISLNTYTIDQECGTNYSVQVVAGEEYCEIETYIFFGSVIYALSSKNVSADREVTPVLQILINFTGSGYPGPLSTIVPFNVTLLDINDNPPSLSQTDFFANEGERQGLILYRLPDYFQDPDNGSNGTFGRVTQLTGKDLMTVDAAGSIEVRGKLDYEEFRVFELNITLYDDGTPQLSSNLTLKIHLVDMNDNAPKFLNISDDTVFSIMENEPPGTFIATITAVDDDSERNANVSYSIVNSALFAIDPLTGRLTSSSAFDREKTSQYTLVVVATDGGTPPLNSSVNLTVRIDDVNDNAPSFENETYRFNTKTNKPIGALVGVVNATDLDSSENGAVDYEILDQDSYFGVNATGHVIIARQLPQEDDQQFNITVIAFNSIDKRMNSTAEVQISVRYVPPPTVTPTPSGFGLMYFAYVVPSLLIALAIAIAITICLICCIRCYRHRSRDLYKMNCPPTRPTKSNLRAVPQAGSRYEDSSNFCRKPSANGANGRVTPKSPTVNFSDTSQVHYYLTEESMLSDMSNGCGGMGLFPQALPDGNEAIELSETLSPDHGIPTKATPPADAETSMTTHGIITSSSSSTVMGPNSLSDDISLSPGSVNTTQDLSHIYNQHSKGPPVLREDLLKKHNKNFANSSFPQAIVEGPLSDRDSDLVNHPPSLNMPRPPYCQHRHHHHRMGGANGDLSYTPSGSEEQVMDYAPRLHNLSHSLPPHPLPLASRTHSNSGMYYGSHAHNGHPPRHMYESMYPPYKGVPPNHLNGSLVHGSSSTSSSSHNTSPRTGTRVLYPYLDLTPPDPSPPDDRSDDYHSNHGHSVDYHPRIVSLHGSHSSASPSSVVRDHSYPTHHTHLPLVQEKILQDNLHYHHQPAPNCDGYSTDEDTGTVASSVLDEYLQFEPPALRHDFLSLSVDDMKLSSTDLDPKHGGGNRRNES